MIRAEMTVALPVWLRLRARLGATGPRMESCNRKAKQISPCLGHVKRTQKLLCMGLFSKIATDCEGRHKCLDQRACDLGACPSNRCSNPSEFDSSLDYEQALSPLEYRSDAASAAECAGLRAQGPRLAVYRWAGAGEPGSQGDHGQLCEWARPAAVRSAHDGFAFAAWLCKRAVFVAAHC